MWRTISASRSTGELAVPPLVSERRHPAHPHALLLRGGDLVADALAGDLALELREGEQHIQGQPPHRSRGVELLRGRDEGNALLVEDLDDLGEVGQRAGQPVNLVADDGIDLPRTDVG